MGLIPKIDLKRVEELQKGISGELLKALSGMSGDIADLNTKQDEIILALITVYQALEVIGRELHVEFPKPLVCMRVEK